MTAKLGGGRGKIGGYSSARGTLKAATWACLAGVALTINFAAQAEPDRRLSSERLEEIADESRDWIRQRRRIEGHGSNI